MNNMSDAIEEITLPLRQQFNTEINWRFDDKFNVMLSEFSQMTSVNVLTELRELFPHEWDVKNIKTSPLSLFDQLSGFTELTKQQLIFTMPAQDLQPAFVAILWPWGHGSTFSLRIKPLVSSYNMEDIRTPLSLIGILKGWFS